MPPGAAFVFPLSPRVCLRTYERQHFSEKARLDGTSTPFINDAVTTYNSLQVLAARELVFSHVANFAEAKTVMRWLQKYPLNLI
jgi:hypothetical protein